MSRTLGVISDTHGLLRPGALTALDGVERILHAGDVGDPGILATLEELAPVTAVHGNVDGGPLRRDLPAYEVVEVGSALIYIRHILEEMDVDPAGAGFHGVIFGHTHRPEIGSRHGVLYLNPGSAGPVRSNLAPTVALLEVTAPPDGGAPRLEAEIVEIEGGS